MDKRDTLDPRGLISEAYSIEGVTEADCRAIFFDWALGQSDGSDLRPVIAKLLALHGSGMPDHPMTTVLTAGLSDPPHPRRRGGRKARIGH
jgi:hypothetical protein